MDSKTKADFLLAVHKHTLKAFDAGGNTIGGGGILGDVGSAVSSFAGDFTPQNTYQAQGPDMSKVVAGQNQLAGKLQTQAAGGGPNPAQIQLQQNAQKIAEQQAAANASNRALNPGLAARQSSETAAGLESNAVANAGAQQASQQLASQGQLASLYGQQQNASLGAAGINSQVQQNNVNAVGSHQGSMFSSLPVIGSFFADGGKVTAHKMAKGGYAGSISTPYASSFSNAKLFDSSSDGDKKPVSGPGQILGGEMPASPMGGALAGPDAADLGGGAGAADIAGSVAPEAALAVAYKGGKVAPKTLMTIGGKVSAGSPSQKAVVPGNSLKNDKVPALLSEGEEVLPREVMQSADPVKAAADFVRAEIAKRGLKGMHGLSMMRRNK